MTPTSSEQLNDSLISEDWPYFDELSIEPEDDQVTDKQSVTCRLTIKPELSYLVGHFPQQAIVPGVVQVHWAGELSKRFFACSGFSSLKKVKFSHPILPKTTLQLSLTYKKDVSQVNFIYRDQQQAYSSGVISFS